MASGVAKIVRERVQLKPDRVGIERAARKPRPFDCCGECGLRALFVWYVALIYVAVLGATFVGSNELTFSAPGTPFRWDNLAFNSAAFLLLLGATNFVPTGLILGLATALRLTAHRRFQDR